MDDIFYAIGDPDVYSMPYLFTLAPDCFYIPTVTVSNLPVFSEHNTDTKIFKVPTTTNLALIGSYVVSISSTITVPVDYTMADWLLPTNTLTATYTFTIYITPCLITSYASSLGIGTLTYLISEPGLTSSKY